MTQFEVVLVGRTPAASAAATLTVVDRLVAESISYTDELNKPGSATISCPVQSLSSAVKARLVDLRTNPCEVWIYTDATKAWAGEIQTYDINSQSLTLNCVGLLGYLGRYGITADITFSAVDQFFIARQLVNNWQNFGYGNWGIDTSGIVSGSGVLRDRTYLRDDLKDVLTAITELGNVIDGFDFYVDPATRALTLVYPKRGSDLSNSVFIDARNVDSGSSVSVSVAPGDVVSDVGLTSSWSDLLGNQFTFSSYQQNTTLQAAFGRCWNGQTSNNVSSQTTLDGQGTSYLAVRGAQLLVPALTVIPNMGMGTYPGSFHPGDTVNYSYDAGLGTQTGNFRVASVTVQVSGADAQPRLVVAFA